MGKIKVALSDGHGYLTAGKRTPDGFNENKFNEKVVGFLKTELERCGFEVLLLAPTTEDTPLKERTDKANRWGADVYVAIHYNALGDKWRTGEGGIETYYYPNSKSGQALASAIHKEVIKGTHLRDRGVKSANLHEVRESHMPAALCELGFMDIKREAELMKSKDYQLECAQEVARGICNYTKVKYIEVKTDRPPVKKPEAPKKPAQPVKPTEPKEPVKTAPKEDIHRITVDNIVVGAFAQDSNIVAQAKKAIDSGAKNIKIELVK